MLRFAISPTKDMDISDLRIALFNHILSKQLNEELLIRIDDTDKEKVIEKKDKEILELLSLFSIDYSRLVYQSENIKYHTGMGMKLLLDKKAFNCFCTKEALENDRAEAKKQGKPYSYSGFCENISDETKFHCNAPFVVRIKKPNENIKVNDTFKGELEYTPDVVDSFVILNVEKTPTKNFASGVDDMLFDISMIIKDENEILDTPRETHVRESLGYDKKINYIHLPKLENSLSVQELVDEGYLPIAIANYILGLGYDTPKEIFSIEESFEWFDINKISTQNLSFNIEELNKINKEYLKELDNLRLSKILGYADDDIGKLGKLYIDECNTTKNIKEKVTAIFSQKGELKGYDEDLKILKECLENAPFIEEFEELKKYITTKTNLEGEKLNQPLSFLLTGEKDEEKLDKIYPYIRNYLGEII